MNIIQEKLKSRESERDPKDNHSPQQMTPCSMAQRGHIATLPIVARCLAREDAHIAMLQRELDALANGLALAEPLKMQRHKGTNTHSGGHIAALKAHSAAANIIKVQAFRHQAARIAQQF